MRILELFCDVDDFCQIYWPQWQQHLLTNGTKQRNRPTHMAPSELMTLVILFHASCYRTFKAFYTQYVCVHLCAEFPTLISYQRFVELKPTILQVLAEYWRCRMGRCTGISFVDWSARIPASTSIASLRTWLSGGIPRSAGFMVSSCMPLSMTEANCWRCT